MDEYLFEPIDQALLENEEAQESTSYSYWRDSWQRLRKNPMAMTGFWILVFLLVMAGIGPWLTPYTYYETHLPLKNHAPSLQFWFGTDELGRDIFTRVWWGARISLFVGISAALIDFAIGICFGALAGWCGGKVDELMMRFSDFLFSIPYLLVVILLMVVIGPGLATIILALTITGWIPMARIVRGQIMQLKVLDYTQAAYAL